MNYTSSVRRELPFSFRISPEARVAFEKAAEKAGLSTSEWARLVLFAAAGVGDLPEQLTRVVEFQAKKVRDGDW